jgi:hypothetical protein
VPNLTNTLQPINLSTAARIIAKMDLSDAGDSRTAFIDSMIEEASSQIGQYLGLHLLAVERTERYEVRRFSKTFSLDAVAVTGTPTLKIARIPSDLATTAAETLDTTYRLDRRTGTIMLFDQQPYDPAFAEVTYTGGFFANAGELGTKHEWLTNAADMQVLYRLQRQDALGGNVDTSQGGGTSFSTGEYQLLKTVRRALQAHRRVIV